MVPAPLATTDPLIVAVVAGLLGGGLLSGVAVLIRAPKQGQLDVMSASKVIYDELRAELEDEREKREKLAADCDDHRIENERLTGRLAQTEAENTFLRERITYVEDQIRRRQTTALRAGEAEARRVEEEDLPVLPRPDNRPEEKSD